MPYKIESNEVLKSEQIRGKKLNKIETESGDDEYIHEIIQDDFYIDNYNGKIVNKEEKKSNFEYEEYEEKRSIFDLIKIKEIFTKSKILNLEITSYNINLINCSEEHNNIYKEKNKISIQINPLGYYDSKRKKDGITYFGYEKEGEETEENEIDIKINPRDNETIDDKYLGKHFQIKFNPNDMQYYLKDLGHGFGTFIKIIDWTEIKNNFLLNIGENYLVFSLGLEKENDINENYIFNNDNNEDENFLNIKIFSSNSNQNSFVFSPKDSPFTIGRKEENRIYIEDNMLSRIHCTIKYKNNKWFIIDGYITEQNELEENKKSTNGSWVYAYDDCLIIDKMSFKSAHYLFECNLVDMTNNEIKDEKNE